MKELEMREVDLDEFAVRWADGVPVVDVRERWEYVDGHVPGALLMPLGQLAARTAEIPAGEVVYVICASGNRSREGARIVEAAGRGAVSVAGGTVRLGRPRPAPRQGRRILSPSPAADPPPGLTSTFPPTSPRGAFV
ncbi:hypothetical protein Rwratislav_45056 [Rhodococcus wratislaviensis IFP 2016]|nr:hypothetical protein Rwratislav_45056 [Rhodococcus wratislaviensis IFP 2016]